MAGLLPFRAPILSNGFVNLSVWVPHTRVTCKQQKDRLTDSLSTQPVQNPLTLNLSRVYLLYGYSLLCFVIFIYDTHKRRKYGGGLPLRHNIAPWRAPQGEDEIIGSLLREIYSHSDSSWLSLGSSRREEVPSIVPVIPRARRIALPSNRRVVCCIRVGPRELFPTGLVITRGTNRTDGVLICNWHFRSIRIHDQHDLTKIHPAQELPSPAWSLEEVYRSTCRIP